MDGSDRKSMSSPTPIKPSSTPNPNLPAPATDENDQSHEEMVMNLHDSRKPTKHFMSPTTSSVSKAIAPRKKILAERNENTDTQFQKSQNASICRDSDFFSLGDDSALNLHDDPLTNYPSPRPKFLRFKPNGRREIILRYEKAAMERKRRADLVGVPQEGDAVEERDEEVEEEEEEEGERGGFLRSFLEFAVVMLVLVFSTVYISSMNSPTSSPTLQALEGLKDGWYLKVHDRMYETMKSFRGEDDRYLKVMKFKEIVKLFGGGGREFINENIGLIKSNQTVFDEVFEEEEMIADVYLGKVEEVSNNLVEVAELQRGESDDFGEMVELQARESTENEVHDHGMEKSGENFDQMVENFELKGTEDVEKLESFEDTFQQESEVVIEPVQEVAMEKSNNIPDNAITDFETPIFEADADLKAGLVEQIEIDITFKAVLGVTLFSAVIISFVFAFHLEKKRNIGKDTKESAPIRRPCGGKNEEMKKCSSEIPTVREENVKCVGKDTKESAPIRRPCGGKNEEMKKCSSEIATVREENVKCVDSFSCPTSLVSNHSNREQGVKESSISFYQSQGPSIELLGEFEVVQMSSSLRSCGMKSRMAESEVSSHSVSLNKAHSVPLQAQPCVSEFSAMNSFSYGQLITPEKKIMKKEDGRDAETKKVVVTTVRRSSRIRNKAITST